MWLCYKGPWLAGIVLGELRVQNLPAAQFGRLIIKEIRIALKAPLLKSGSVEPNKKRHNTGTLLGAPCVCAEVAWRLRNHTANAQLPPKERVTEKSVNSCACKHARACVSVCVCILSSCMGTRSHFLFATSLTATTFTASCRGPAHGVVMLVNEVTHTHTHTHTHTRTHTLALKLRLRLSDSHTLTLSHSHTLTLSHTHTHTLTHLLVDRPAECCM